MKQTAKTQSKRETLKVSGKTISVPSLRPTSVPQTETSGIGDWRVVVGMFIKHIMLENLP